MPLPIINTLSFTLFAIIFPVFIFTVTLLGSAIHQTKLEESKAKEQQKIDYELKINDMENKIKEAKKTGDTSELETELSTILENKKEFENQIKKINKKYSLIQFKEAVIFPGFFFIL